MSAGVPFRGILAVRVGLTTWWHGGLWKGGRIEGGLKARRDDREGAFDLGVARAELDRVEIEQRQRLREHKQMLRAPGSGQCQRNLIRLLFAAVIAQGRQGVRIPLTRDDGPDNPQPSNARDIAECLGQLDRHL